MPGRPTTLHAYLACLAGIALYSAMDMVMKGLTLAVGVFAALLWRCMLGTALAGIAFVAGRHRLPDRPTAVLHLARGLIIGAMALLFFWGLARVPMAQAVALTFIAPLIALFLGAVLLGEAVGKRALGGSLLALGGVVVILGGQAQADLGGDALLGCAALLASAVIYAINLILLRRQALVAGPVEIVFFQNAVVALALLAALPLIGSPPVGELPWGAIVIAALLALVSAMLLAWSYARAGAGYLSTTEYSAFLWSMLFGWWAFGESVSPFTVGGAVLIVAGCILAASDHRALAAIPQAAV